MSESKSSSPEVHGWVNNAGRFRSEIGDYGQTKKKRESLSFNESTSNETDPDRPKDECTDMKRTKGSVDSDPDLTFTLSTELGKMGIDSDSMDVESRREDYLMLGLIPADPVSYVSFRTLPTPVHLENPESETRWYFEYFLGKYHQLYCGYANEKDPFLLAVAKTSVQSYGIAQYRSVLWRKTGSQKLCISYNPSTTLTAKKVLNFFDLHRIDKGPKEVSNFEVQKDALTLEEQEGSVNFKFGVIYCIEGQTSDEQMYNNEHGSEEFNQFVRLLGDRITLKSWDHFKGGLDTKSNTTGLESVYTIYEGHEIMFHISTLLPFATDHRQQIERKRHIGNDIVNIIYVDGVGPDQTPSWKPSMMKTHFTHIFAIVTYYKETSSYRLNVFSEESVPAFGPPLPNPPEFSNPQAFREFLLVKLINGEKAAFHSPVFAQKRERTLEMLLHVICSSNLPDTANSAVYRRALSDVLADSLNGVTTNKEQARQDEFIRYGQMLKLNTIIRGNAPTSCITSGQAKRNPWQYKHFHTPFQGEIFCADTWNGHLFVSTEIGMLLLKEYSNPILVLEQSIDVKQIEVVDNNELLVIRFDKGRESRIAVLSLTDHDFSQPMDRTQVKKISLEKTKGCHVFALTKSIMQPLKMAVVVQKRLIIYQWQVITGHSLSAWNQIAQTNSPENFQLIREIPLIDPVQTLTFVERIPTGRICVGHKNQFDLIDERTKEISQLFRAESSRNQVVCAHELWDVSEPELLLCFTRTCHFQKVNTLVLGCTTPRKLHSSETTASMSIPQNQCQSSDTSGVVSTSVPSAGSYPSSANVFSSFLPTVSSSSDYSSGSPGVSSPNVLDKFRGSEFDFTWNFEPEEVVASYPYIIAFTSTSIELRLISNGSLVHTMLVPGCHLIAHKRTLFFTSFADNLDSKCGGSGLCWLGKATNESSHGRRLDSQSPIRQPTNDSELMPFEGPTMTCANFSIASSTPPSDTEPTRPRHIYRINFIALSTSEETTETLTN